ncbi:GNAT family N-acetyltransferase [Streptomyces sp. SID14478]|uniref:GNAT family N-acetyltransferase n=1 Tax=Streptomyces sp. SID14478 TaxID=2706073 RepID=UPI0013DEC630|nr:GNAT family N-acetyltransferase [Streptomyces sp. SID14478]NEB80374.1 GNAT family N-acetyltransferase [Streptomyces sp. SID14478]
MTEIHTPRLLLRRWHEIDDLHPLAEIHSQPEVMRFLGDGSVLDADATAGRIEEWEEEWDDEGFGVFAVELLGSGELAGAVGLTVPQGLPEYAHEVAVTWLLGRQFWGQGYASEAAQATLEYALQDRGLERIVALTKSADEASANVVRKLGMTFEKEITRPAAGPSDAEDTLRVHAIDLTEYEA